MVIIMILLIIKYSKSPYILAFSSKTGKSRLNKIGFHAYSKRLKFFRGKCAYLNESTLLFERHRHEEMIALQKMFLFSHPLIKYLNGYFTLGVVK